MLLHEECTLAARAKRDACLRHLAKALQKTAKHMPEYMETIAPPARLATVVESLRHTDPEKQRQLRQRAAIGLKAMAAANADLVEWSGLPEAARVGDSKLAMLAHCCDVHTAVRSAGDGGVVGVVLERRRADPKERARTYGAWTGNSWSMTEPDYALLRTAIDAHRESELDARFLLPSTLLAANVRAEAADVPADATELVELGVEHLEARFQEKRDDAIQGLLDAWNSSKEGSQSVLTLEEFLAKFTLVDKPSRDYKWYKALGTRMQQVMVYRLAEIMDRWPSKATVTRRFDQTMQQRALHWYSTAEERKAGEVGARGQELLASWARVRPGGTGPTTNQDKQLLLQYQQELSFVMGTLAEQYNGNQCIMKWHWERQYWTESDPVYSALAPLVLRLFDPNEDYEPKKEKKERKAKKAKRPRESLEREEEGEEGEEGEGEEGEEKSKRAEKKKRATEAERKKKQGEDAKRQVEEFTCKAAVEALRASMCDA